MEAIFLKVRKRQEIYEIFCIILYIYKLKKRFKFINFYEFKVFLQITKISILYLLIKHEFFKS